MSGRAIVTCVFTVTLLVLAVAGARADVFNMPAGQTSLQTVFVGDPGNVPDTAPGQTGAGSVGYNYYIGKYDVTNAQYCQFLNAQLPNISDPIPAQGFLPSDTYGLYNPFVVGGGLAELDPNVGIAYDPNGATGAKFSTISGRANWPVVNVEWEEALRFANWLQNGQGNGDTESGTYLITNGGQNTGSLPYPIRSGETPSSTGGHWVLPSQDEWYKAAYYKGGGTNSGYWLYPTSSNSTPSYYPPGTPGADPTNSANYYSPPAVGYPRATDHPLDVGSYPESVSPYGTLDQGGNASQWNEMAANYNGLLGGGDYSGVEVRGGNCDLAVGLLQSPNYNAHPGTGGGGTLDNFGFRVAYVPDTEVPEPGSITLAIAGGLGLLACAWRQRRV